MGGVSVVEVFDAKIEVTFSWVSVMHPQSRRVGAGMISMRGKLSNKVPISKKRSLLEALHAFLDLYIDVTILINDGEIFVFNPHVFEIFHGCSQEMVLEVGTHEPGAFVSIGDGAVNDQLRLEQRGSW
jgi:hypothetical protein